MLLYDKKNKEMASVIKCFKRNGGDILIDAVCSDQDYNIDFFEAHDSFRPKWIVALAPKDKTIHLNSKNSNAKNTLGLAKVFASELAHKKNFTEVYDPKFQSRVKTDYKEIMLGFVGQSNLTCLTQYDVEKGPMINGLKGHKANLPNWKRSMKRIKNFSKIAVE